MSFYHLGGRKGTVLHARNKTSPESPLGTVIQSIAIKDLAESAEAYKETASITNSSFVISFNWLEKSIKLPTIIVPGQPPKWTPLNEAKKLKEDSGRYFRDLNAARYPLHPMEPTVLALMAADNNSELMSALDIVACGSTLGSLLRFVRAQDKPFRMLVEVVGDTVFFVRRENSPTETIPDVRGYGHTFPEAYTSWEADVKGSESHQRLIKYSFCGLKILLRAEGDGYIGRKEPKIGTKVENVIEEDLLLGNLSIDASMSTTSTENNPGLSRSKLEIRKAGAIVDQSLIFDLKTRSAKKRTVDVLSQELPRLWLRQIPNFILAWHTDGVFKDIEIKQVTKDIEEWEQQHKDELAKLGALLHLLIAKVRAKKYCKVEVRLASTGSLEIREQLPGAGCTLSNDTRARWIGASQKESKNTSCGFEWVSGNEKEDFTACTELCGYCGQCALSA